MSPFTWAAMVLGVVVILIGIVLASAAGQVDGPSPEARVAICLLHTPDEQELACFSDLNIP